MKNKTEISFHCPKGPCRKRLKKTVWMLLAVQTIKSNMHHWKPPYSPLFPLMFGPKPSRRGPITGLCAKTAKGRKESALTPLSLGQDPSLNATLLEAQVGFILAVFSLLPICMQELPGNNDVNSVVISKFLRPFVARLVRVHPILQTTFGYLRLELYGCKGNSVWLAVKWFYTLTDYPNLQSAKKTEV